MPAGRRDAHRGTALALSGLAALVWLHAGPAAGQQGPIRLFPELAPGTPQQPEARPGPQPPRPLAPERAPELVPAPQGGVQVEGLPAPGVDGIGLSGPAEGGFSQDIWRGSPRPVVLQLLSGLPVETRNPPLHALARRLLATGAPLVGAGDPGRVLEARIEGLLAMGELDTAKQLLDQLPSGGSDSALARRAVETALLTGDDEAACRRAAGIAPGSEAAFWGKVTVYCRLVQDDVSAARLGLDLLRDAGHGDDQAFFRLATAIADRKKDGALPELGEASPLHVALLRQAKLPLPAKAIEPASPAVLAAAARQPALAGEHRLEIVERAFAAGAISGDDVAAVYAASAPEDVSGALERVQSDWSPKTRALAYRAVREQPVPAARAELLDAVWRAAEGPERFLVAAAFAEPFAGLPVDGTMIPVAASLARALLVADRPTLAARWFALVQDSAARDPRARSAAAGLAPLFALAGLGGGQGVPTIDADALAAWRSSTPDADAKMDLLLTLLDGVGVPVPDGAWQQLLAPPLEQEMRVPSTAVWQGLEEASAGGRVGETILYALHMMAGAPERSYPKAVSSSLAALRAVGLDQQARAIAVAGAIGDGL